MLFTIRQETMQDTQEVYRLVKTAFLSAEHSDGTEQDLVTALHKSENFLPALSLVAEEEGGRLVGYALFTKVTLGSFPTVILAPLAVHPDCQKQGVGTRLLQEGHRIAKELGFAWSVLLGSEHYYPRVGYRPAAEFGIRFPFDVPPQNLMALHLQGKGIPRDCMVECDKAFL